MIKQTFNLEVELKIKVGIEASSVTEASEKAREMYSNKFTDTKVVIRNETMQRTAKQNNALHVYFQWVADALNETGTTWQKVLSSEFDLKFTSHNIKEGMWKPLQKIALGKDSTKSLTKNSKEIDDIYDSMNQRLSEMGIHVPFPSLEE